MATGRLTSMTDPETGTVSYTYNADGSLATKTDAKNQTISYDYDLEKRVTQISGPGSPIQFTYDTDPFGLRHWGQSPGGVRDGPVDNRRGVRYSS